MASREEYLIQGVWMSEGVARHVLFCAVSRLERSTDDHYLDGARLIRRNWRAIAARPPLADQLISDSYEAIRAQATREMTGV